MCGILGIINLNNQTPIDERLFRSALRTLRHRGPDAEEIKRISDDTMLGHTRLSVIDLREISNQPMRSDNGRYWITYNGEVYNYGELRKELEELGVAFRTNGDTEVVLYAYIVWGPTCVKRFNGMWAIAIYDTQSRSLFCSRDRFGVKPFNYAIADDRFLFASEIKAMLVYTPLLAEPNYEAISNYCRTSVGAQNSQTWFRDVRRIPPGCNLFLNDGEVRIERYWQYPNRIVGNIGFEEAKKKYKELFRDAVRIRMRSDVPVGITLSAGIDSTSISYMMGEVAEGKHHSFTSRFVPEDGLETDSSIYTKSESIDESIAAAEVASELDYESHIVNTTFDDFIPSLSKIVYHLESGNSSPAVVPLMQLLEEAKEYVTVLLDGQGADELLGGYILNTFWPAISDLVRQGQFGKAARSFCEFRKTYRISYAIKMALRDLSNEIDIIAQAHQKLSGRDKVFGTKLRNFSRWKDYIDRPGEGNKTQLGRTLQNQHSGGLINLLHYGDAISMANGIESRMPFLDYRLVEYVWQLPSEYKVKLAIGKFLHREAMRNLVPDKILDQKVKFGFSTPIAQWFRSNRHANEHPLDILLDNRSQEREVFDIGEVNRVIEEHRQGKQDHSTLLFRMLNVELWFRQFIDKPIKAP